MTNARSATALPTVTSSRPRRPSRQPLGSAMGGGGVGPTSAVSAGFQAGAGIANPLKPGASSAPAELGTLRPATPRRAAPARPTRPAGPAGDTGSFVIATGDTGSSASDRPPGVSQTGLPASGEPLGAGDMEAGKPGDTGAADE